MYINSKPNLHFFCSVFLTSTGLGNFSYDLGNVFNSSDDFFRLSRFLTALNSYKDIPWKSVTIFFDTEERWKIYSDSIKVSILSIFPEAKIFTNRLSSRIEWENATKSFNDREVIFLQTNDDHAFVAQSADEFFEIVNRIEKNDEAPLGSVTHFPEILGVYQRELIKNIFRKRPIHRYIDAIGTIGTVLVRSDFLKSWWTPGRIPDNVKIVRPDNPFGPSVEFSKVKIFVPKMELVRHMDGYSHANLRYPVSPLRNLLVFDPNESLGFRYADNPKWNYRLWPTRLYAYNSLNFFGKKNSADMLSIVKSDSDTDSLLTDLRLGVARLQTAWSWRIMVSDSIHIFNGPSSLRKVTFIPALLIALFSKSTFKNFFDILDFFILAIFFPLKNIPIFRRFMNDIYYLGFWRTAIRYLNR